MRILEGACPQLMAEEHGKGERMRPHGKQAGSVTDVEFEGFHMVCDILPNPGVRRGGNSRSGSGRGPGLVREAESCSAIPFPGEGIASSQVFGRKFPTLPSLRNAAVAPITPLQHSMEGKSIQWLRFPFPPFPPPYPPHIPLHIPKGRNDLGELLTLCGTLCLPLVLGGWDNSFGSSQGSEGVWNSWPAAPSVFLHALDPFSRNCSPGIWEEPPGTAGGWTGL